MSCFLFRVDTLVIPHTRSNIGGQISLDSRPSREQRQCLFVNGRGSEDLLWVLNYHPKLSYLIRTLRVRMVPEGRLVNVYPRVTPVFVPTPQGLRFKGTMAVERRLKSVQRIGPGPDPTWSAPRVPRLTIHRTRREVTDERPRIRPVTLQ